MSEILPIPSSTFFNDREYVSVRDSIDNILGHWHPVYEFSTGDESVFENVDRMARAGDAPRMREIIRRAKEINQGIDVLIHQVRLAHKYPIPPWEMINPPGGDNPVRI
jgi:hypothetical protein